MVLITKRKNNMFKDQDWIFTDEVKEILDELLEEIENIK